VLCFAAQLKLDTSLVSQQHNVECTIATVFPTAGAIVVDRADGHPRLLRNTLSQVIRKPIDIVVGLYHDAGTGDILQLNKATGQSLQLADDLGLSF